MDTVHIKVLGTEASRCTETEKMVKEAALKAGVKAEIEKIRDTMEIVGYCIFGTPAVIINDEVKCVGRIPSREDVKTWFANF